MKGYSLRLVVFLILQLVCRFSEGVKEDTELSRPLTCGHQTSAKHFVVSGTDPGRPFSCIYKIVSHSHAVRQLYLRFRFNLAPPIKPLIGYKSSPICRDDFLQVGGNRFCGSEHLQHLYIPINQTSGNFSLLVAFVLAPRSHTDTKLPSIPFWWMHITQLEEMKAGEKDGALCSEAARTCWDLRRPLAPPGCLQYYDEEENYISSFNYRYGEGIYPAGLDYSICIRHPPGAWALRLEFLEFNLRGGGPSTNQTLSRQYCSSFETADSLMIPSSIIEPKTADDFLFVNDNHYCGRSLQNRVVIAEDSDSDAVTFRMYFRSQWSPMAKRRAGFLFQYKVLYENDALIYTQN